MAKDLRVPIFVTTLFTVREAQRMSLAQDAAETRELDLLRDTRHCYRQFSVLWPQGTKKVAECGLLRGEWWAHWLLSASLTLLSESPVT